MSATTPTRRSTPAALPSSSSSTKKKKKGTPKASSAQASAPAHGQPAGSSSRPVPGAVDQLEPIPSIDTAVCDGVLRETEALVKEFNTTPLNDLFKQVAASYKRLDQIVAKVVVAGPRGAGKSSSINAMAVSYGRLLKAGFENLWGRVPLHAGGRGLTVTTIPSLLLYDDKTVSCQLELSDGTTVDIYPLAVEKWSTAQAQQNTLSLAPVEPPPFVRELQTMAFANQHAKELLEEMRQREFAPATPTASPVVIKRMLLRNAWAFGPALQLGDTLGWEGQTATGLSFDGQLRDADCVVSVTSRGMAEDELVHLLKHGAFSDYTRPAVLLNLFHVGSSVGQPLKHGESSSSAAAAAVATVAAPPPHPYGIAPSPVDADAETIEVVQRAIQRAFDNKEALPHVARWEQRKNVFQSLQQNVVMCALQPDRAKLEAALRLALTKITNNCMRKRYIDFIKEVSQLVFSANRRASTFKLSPRLRSYLRTKLPKQAHKEQRKLLKIIDEKTQALVEVFNLDAWPPAPVAAAAAGAAAASSSPSASSVDALPPAMIPHFGDLRLNPEAEYHVSLLQRLLYQTLQEVQQVSCDSLLVSLIRRFIDNKPKATASNVPAAGDAAGGGVAPMEIDGEEEKSQRPARDAPATPAASPAEDRAQAGDSAVIRTMSTEEKEDIESLLTAQLDLPDRQKAVRDLEAKLLDELIRAGVEPLQTLLANVIAAARQRAEDDGKYETAEEQEGIVRKHLAELLSQEVRKKYLDGWVKKFVELAGDIWQQMCKSIGDMEKSLGPKAAPATLTSLSTEKCKELKQKLTILLKQERNRQEQETMSVPELKAGGTASDNVRMQCLPKASRVYESVSRMVSARPPAASAIEKAITPDFHTRCTTFPVTHKVGAIMPAPVASARPQPHKIKITFASQRESGCTLTASFSDALSSHIARYQHTVCDGQFGTRRHDRDVGARQLFPIATPLWLECESDAGKQLDQVWYGGMQHLVFFLLSDAQQVAWMEEALALRPVSDLDNIVIVEALIEDAAMHLDILRSLLTSFKFDYAWRRTMNVKNVKELHPVTFSTYSCDIAFAMFSLQFSMCEFFQYTLTKVAEHLTTDMENKMSVRLARALTEEEHEKVLGIAKRLRDDSLSRSVSESELREFIAVLAMPTINRPPESVFDPIIKAAQPYFFNTMLELFAAGYMVHSYLPIFPDLHQVFYASARAHSLVLEHLPALGEAAFTTPEVARAALSKAMQTSLKASAKQPITVESYLFATLQAEQRSQKRVENKKVCAPHIICASFGSNLQLYTTRSNKNTKKKKPASETGAAAATTDSAQLKKPRKRKPAESTKKRAVKNEEDAPTQKKKKAKTSDETEP